MLKEKIHSPTLCLDPYTLDFIERVASFYNISRSEVVSWAINASIKDYDKAYKKSIKRLYKRRRANEKAHKIQVKDRRSRTTKTASKESGTIDQQLFDFAT